MKKILIIFILLSILLPVLFSCKARPSSQEIQAVLDKSEWLWTNPNTSFGLPSLRMIHNDIVIYFDPGSLDFAEKHPPADIIFITHNDRDHMNLTTIRQLKKEDTILITNAYSTRNVINDFDSDHLMIVEAGDEILVKGIPLKVVPMYRPFSARLHPKERGYTGYILTLNEVRFYFSGSAGLMDELKDFKRIDIACMNVRGMIYTGGTEESTHAGAGGHDSFNLDKDEALKAISILKPKVFFPIYWHPDMRRDIDYILENGPHRVEVYINPPGEK